MAMGNQKLSANNGNLKKKRSFISTFLVLALIGLPLVLTHYVSASDGTSHESGLPSVFWLQIVNFIIYVVILGKILAQPIREFFTARHEQFFSAVKKAETAKAQAEERRREIKSKLDSLESTKEASIQNAKKEAEALRLRIVEEAKTLSSKIRMDAERTVQAEVNRAKEELREELLTQSIQLSKKILADKMQESDQKRLQSEFVDKIQVVTQ